jgi:hypothetical protein
MCSTSPSSGRSRVGSGRGGAPGVGGYLRGVDRAAGHAGGRQLRNDRWLPWRAPPRSRLRVLRGSASVARWSQARVLTHSRRPRARRNLQIDWPAADHQITVLCLHALVGRVLAMATGGSAPHGRRAIGPGPRAGSRSRSPIRALTKALAGALALVERGSALHRPHPGAEIADRQADEIGSPSARRSRA